MSKQQLYNEAKELARRLNEGLRVRYVGSTVAEVRAELDRLNSINQRATLLREIQSAPQRQNIRAIQALDNRLSTGSLFQSEPIRLAVATFERLYEKRRVLKAEGELLRNGQEVEQKLQDGNTKTTVNHIVPNLIRLRINVDNLEAIRIQLLRVLRQHKALIGENRFLIRVKDLRRPNNNIMSGSFQIGRLIKVVDNLIASKIGPYARGNDSGQRQEGFEIGLISIEVFKQNVVAMGKSLHSIVQAQGKWITVSPKSKINCLFQAIATCRNFTHQRILLDEVNGNEYRVSAGRDLKKKVKNYLTARGEELRDNFADYESIQACSNYTRYPIKLYNNVFNLIKTFEPVNPLKSYKNGDCYEIQVSAAHAIALIDKKLIKTTGKSSRSIAQANRKWLTVSPKSKINCLFQAIATCRNYTHNRILLDEVNGNENRVKAGKDLKKMVNTYLTDQGMELRDNLTDYEIIQACANYTRYPINIYNNIFQLSKTFDPVKPLKRYKNEKCYEIQVSQVRFSKENQKAHTIALINKKRIKEIYDDFEFPKIDTIKPGRTLNIVNGVGHIEQKEAAEVENKVIEKRRTFDTYNRKFAAWDIETATNGTMRDSHIPYASSIAWFDYDITYEEKTKNVKNKKTGAWTKKTYQEEVITGRRFMEKQFWGLDCLKQLSKWIYQNKSIFNGYTLYAHNGGKYDLPLIIKRAFIDSDEWLIEGKGCVELNNSWIGFKIRAKNDRKFSIIFRDSCRLLPGSLAKLASDFRVEYQKLHETVNHESITLLNWGTFPQLVKYLTHDVFGLLEIIEKFGKGVFKDLGIDITGCYTGASLSKKNFFKNYYNPTKNPIYTLKPEIDKYIRDSYYGGRVECFEMGHINSKLYYYDFTSLYPDVGRRPLPYGAPVFEVFNNATTLPVDWFGWTKCMVKTKNYEEIPKHAMLNKGRLIFPILQSWTEMTVFSDEIDYDIYEYRFIDGYRFKKDKFKAKFFNDGFVNKAQAKSDGNVAMAQAYKIIINSGYGFWGLRTADRDGVQIFEPGDLSYLYYMNTDKLTNLKEENGYVFCRMVKDLDIVDFNVAIAAAISSYARSKLHGLLTAIKKVGGKVFYCDTDSVICNINLNNFKHIKQQYQWDGDGSELGSLKNECDEKVEGLLSKLYSDKSICKQEFNKLVKSEGGNLSFDKGCITGCKQYALSKTITIQGKKHVMEIVKIKGYSQSKDKLKYDDMVILANGGSIKQTQTQFRCPKSNYIAEGYDSFDIKSKKIDKGFRMVYTKGVRNLVNNPDDLNGENQYNCIITPLHI